MEPPSSNDVHVINRSGRRVRQQPLKSAVQAVLCRHRMTGEVSILLAESEEVRDLNQRFRGLDEATDVLTFPAGEFAGAPLGDIAISVPFAEQQARARGVSLSEELAYLVIHGALHLAGFDDEAEEERLRMVREMNVVAAELGLKGDEDWCSLLHAEASS